MSNLPLLKRAVQILEPLLDQLVFVGGSVLELLLDGDTTKPRVTDDVDCIVELCSILGRVKLDEALRRLNLKNDKELVTRWWLQDEEIGKILIDIMPTEGEAAQFADNRWYPISAKNWFHPKVKGLEKAKIIQAPYFFATKAEAYPSRDKYSGNYRIYESHDLEDIVVLISGRAAIFEEIEMADPKVRKFLSEFTFELVNNPNYEEAIEGHLGPQIERFQAVDEVLRNIAALHH